VEGDSCSLKGELEVACHFCKDDTFTRQHRQAAFTKNMIRRKDCNNLVFMILDRGLLRNEDASQTSAGEQMHTELDHMLYGSDFCRMEDLAETLRSYVRADVPFRIYESWMLPFPCYPSSKETTRGFFYVKVPKTASTTVAGVARRIADHKGRQMNSSCNLRAGHKMPRKGLDYDKRELSKSFLFTFIREPAERALSSFFYHEVSKKSLIASDENFLKVSCVERYLWKCVIEVC
jgi:hypothetical protein